jgi:glycosyltransferase involved in cell wall biosynthesis
MTGVGICTRNCEETIESVIKTADEGLQKYFPNQPQALIIVSDGFSEDKTVEIAKNTKTKNTTIVLSQEGGLGKGNGVKTIIKNALEEKLEAIALIDGDLTSVDPSWIDRLISPILNGRDLCIPFYVRHPWDGVITNQIAYPLTSSLYGKEVRQPIGGEFSLSNKFMKRVSEHPLFPEHFGIDIFFTTVGIAEGFNAAECVLGKKEHTSVKMYKEPMKLLIPMFYQVVSSLFDLYVFYKEKAHKIHDVSKVTRYGKVPSGISLNAPTVDMKMWLDAFRNDYEKFYLSSSWKELFKPLESEIEEAIKQEPFNFDIPLWSKCVFTALKNYEKDKQGIMDVLRVFWEARYISLVEASNTMSYEDIEKIIASQVDIFLKLKTSIL